MARKTNLTSRTKKNRQEKERQRQKASQKGSQGTDSLDLGGFQSCEVSARSEARYKQGTSDLLSSEYGEI